MSEPLVLQRQGQVCLGLRVNESDDTVSGKPVKQKSKVGFQGLPLNAWCILAWLGSVTRLSLGFPDCWFAFPTGGRLKPRKQGVFRKREKS